MTVSFVWLQSVVNFKFTQTDWQCTYSVTMRTFVGPMLQWKDNKYYRVCVCVCRLRYPACSEHASYCHLWSSRLYYISPHWKVNGTIKKNKSAICLILSTNLSETFLVLTRSDRDMIKNVKCKTTLGYYQILETLTKHSWLLLYTLNTY